MPGFLSNLSNIIIPVFLFYIIAYGLIKKRDVYEDFVSGAISGGKTVIGILPTLIGLMVAVGILRASGFLDLISKLLGNITKYVYVPSEIIPLVIVRLFSASAATGVLVDLYKIYGTDSFIGLMASIMMSSTETVFYTMSVYFMSVKVTKTRWTLGGALLCVLTGVVISAVICSRQN